MILILFILLLGIQQVTAQSLWSDPIPVSHGYIPNFDIDPNTSTLHIIAIGSSGGATYAVTDSVGNILQPWGIIPGTEKEGIGPIFFNPGIAVDNGGNPHICFREVVNSDLRLYNLYYLRKGASQWNTPLKIANSVYRGYVVAMDIDDNDYVHIARSVIETNPWGHAVYNRIEQGSLIKITPGFYFQRGDDRLALVSTPEGVIHMVLGCPGIEGSPTYEGAITYFKSTDAGETWSDGLDIHSFDCPERNGSPSVFADTLGNVHICYGARADNSILGHHSVRYVRFENGSKARDMVITQPGELADWGHKSYGLAQVASTEDGEIVMIAYLSTDGGDLYVRTSQDGGDTWSFPNKIAETVGGLNNDSGQNIHRLIAYRNHFYVVYQNIYDKQVYMQYIRNVGDLAPTADIAGPYSGSEGQTLTFDASGSFDNGQNQGIVEYAWDIDGNGIYDEISTTPTLQHDYTDDFQGKLKLRITDRSGKQAHDSTTIEISNVPPTVEAGMNQSADEGTMLDFSCSISDPGNDMFSIHWQFGDGQTEEGNIVQNNFGDDGTYTVIVTVTDDDGGIDKDSLKVTIFNVPPVAEAYGPYLAPIHMPITFIGNASDPGTNDQLTYTWDLNGDHYFESSGQQVEYAFHANGQYLVWLKVEDGDGGEGIDSAFVHIANDPPVILYLPSQTVNEGESFDSIFLDLYVEDPDQADDMLSWSVKGYQELMVTLSNRILEVAVPDSEWYGHEKLTLVVEDPGQLSDSIQITYTVHPINDPPVLSDIPDYGFIEDNIVAIALSYLRSLVFDVDDVDSLLVFGITGNQYVQWYADPDTLFLIPALNWHGQENIYFTVTDTSGSTASDLSTITVTSVPDQPEMFSLIDPLFAQYDSWPDTISFLWEESVDADSGDIVDYEWTLSWQGHGFISDKKYITRDSTFKFPSDTLLPEGTYLWWVTASDPSNLGIRSENRGIIIIGIPTDVTDASTQIPKVFQLLPNYPNPFNPETNISYHLPEEVDVRLSVFNTLGQEICVLVNERQSPGIYTAIWAGQNDRDNLLSSGIYICRLKAGSRIIHQKMMYIR